MKEIEKTLNMINDIKQIAQNHPQAMFYYFLVRAIRANRVIEFGKSFGISTIYLALALRDNWGGQLIGTEIHKEKAKKVILDIETAGLSKYVDIRMGNPIETLKDISGPVDFLLNDGFPPSALPVLKLVAPYIRPGGVVVSDNVDPSKADHREYIDYLRKPENGFQSARLELNKRVEFSIKVSAYEPSIN